MSAKLQDLSATLEGEQLVGTYLLLKKHEDELDHTLSVLAHSLERTLYRSLSIEEMEQLGELYRQGRLGSGKTES